MLVRTLLVAAGSLFAIVPALAADAKRPLTGTADPAFAGLDRAILEFLDSIDAAACTVAVSKDGKLLYSRGYGWQDEKKAVAVKPDAFFRIASVTKPVTSAAVHESVRAGRLKFDDLAFDRIPLKAPPADPLVKTITVSHLLEHEGGWDTAATFDPLFRSKEIARELKLRQQAVTPADVIEYMLARKLQFEPGAKSAYSNFGYLVLGRVLEAAEKKATYFACVESLVLKPAGIADVKPAKRLRDPREVWYPSPGEDMPVELLDSAGGLIATAPALATFLEAYWLTGDTRKARERGQAVAFGSIPGTTAMALQRADGRNVCVLINARRDGQFRADNARLQKCVDEALDAIPAK